MMTTREIYETTCEVYVDTQVTPEALAYRWVRRDADGEVLREESGGLDGLADLASLAGELDEGASVEAYGASGRPTDMNELLLEYWADQPGALHLEYDRDKRLAVSIIDAVLSDEPYEELELGAWSTTFDWLEEVAALPCLDADDPDHQHFAQKTSDPFPYLGPVAVRGEENPRAHGNVCVVEMCACGASRGVLRNAGAEECGPWERKEGV